MVNGKGYSFECDIWSIGVLMFECLTGKCPFFTPSYKDTYSNISNAKYKCPLYISVYAKSLIKKLLVLDPKERITLSNLLNEKWLTINN